MLILASAADKLQLITGGGGSIDAHVSWLDNVSGSVDPGRKNTPTITTATTTDICPSPIAGVYRNIKTVYVRNRGGAAVDVTLRHTDGVTPVELHKTSLGAGQTLQYIDEIGFFSTVRPPQGGSFIHGLKGAPQSGRTKVDFTYDEATMRNPIDGSNVFIVTQGFTVDINVVGYNGRDQAAALSDVGVHFYTIYGPGVPTGGLASHSPPPAGPTLPAGYTHWAYLTTLRKDSGQIVIVHIEGSKVTFDPQVLIISGGADNSSGGAPTSPISMSNFVPQIGTNILLEVEARMAVNGDVTAGAVLNMGPIAGGFVSRQCRVDNNGSSLGGIAIATNSFSPTIPNIGQTYYYIWQPLYNGGSIQSYAANIWVAGYEVPNGD
jgi:hypothetical protein